MGGNRFDRMAVELDRRCGQKARSTKSQVGSAASTRGAGARRVFSRMRTVPGRAPPASAPPLSTRSSPFAEARTGAAPEARRAPRSSGRAGGCRDGRARARPSPAAGLRRSAGSRRRPAGRVCGRPIAARGFRRTPPASRYPAAIPEIRRRLSTRERSPGVEVRVEDRSAIPEDRRVLGPRRGSSSPIESAECSPRPLGRGEAPGRWIRRASGTSPPDPISARAARKRSAEERLFAKGPGDPAEAAIGTSVSSSEREGRGRGRRGRSRSTAATVVIHRRPASASARGRLVCARALTGGIPPIARTAGAAAAAGADRAEERREREQRADGHSRGRRRARSPRKSSTPNAARIASASTTATAELLGIAKGQRRRDAAGPRRGSEARQHGDGEPASSERRAPNRAPRSRVLQDETPRSRRTRRSRACRRGRSPVRGRAAGPTVVPASAARRVRTGTGSRTPAGAAEGSRSRRPRKASCRGWRGSSAGSRAPSPRSAARRQRAERRRRRRERRLAEPLRAGRLDRDPENRAADARAPVKTSAARKSSPKSAASRTVPRRRQRARRDAPTRIHGSSAIPGWMCGKKDLRDRDAREGVRRPRRPTLPRVSPSERRSTRTPMPGGRPVQERKEAHRERKRKSARSSDAERIEGARVRVRQERPSAGDLGSPDRERSARPGVVDRLFHRQVVGEQIAPGEVAAHEQRDPRRRRRRAPRRGRRPGPVAASRRTATAASSARHRSAAAHHDERERRGPRRAPGPSARPRSPGTSSRQSMRWLPAGPAPRRTRAAPERSRPG